LMQNNLFHHIFEKPFYIKRLFYFVKKKPVNLYKFY